MVQSMGGVLMKTKTKISYVILKYDDQTDNVFTKTLNNENHVYEGPSFDLAQNKSVDLSDIKENIIEKAVDYHTYIDENHIFIPFINVTFENEIAVYNYIAVVFESNKNTFSSMNYESWHRVKFDHRNHAWRLAWGSGLTDPVDFNFKDVSDENYAANPEGSPEIDFSNVMRFVAQETQKFPILGLMSGEKFTMKQVLHYQDLLGIEALKAGDNATFENQYSDSIQTIKDDRITTFYKIKSEYLQK